MAPPAGDAGDRGPVDRGPVDRGPVDRDVLGRIVDASPDAVIVVDAEGRIVYWNAGAERIFGYGPSDAIGATLDLIVPERLRERHWTGFHEAVGRGSSRYGPGDLLAVPALTASGGTISIEFTVALETADGRVAHVGAVVRDVTERRARESDLRRRVAELEGGGS